MSDTRDSRGAWVSVAMLDQLLEAIARRIVELEREQRAAEQEGGGQTDERQQRSPWLSLASAAAYLDFPRQRLYKLSAQGAMPHYKQDGRLLFRRDELDAWLAGFAQGERS